MTTTTIISQHQWNTSPTAYIEIKCNRWRSGADMCYSFAYKVWLANSSSWYYDGLSLSFYSSETNQTITATVKSYNSAETGWTYEGITGTMTVPNKLNGTVPIQIKLTDTNNSSVKLNLSTTLQVDPAASILGEISAFDVDGYVIVPITKYDSSLPVSMDAYCVIGTVANYVGSFQNASLDQGRVAFVTFSEYQKETIYNLMTNVQSATFQFRLKTYDASGNLIGSNMKTATGTITNASPTIDDTLIVPFDDESTTTNVTKDASVFVQNKSRLVVSVPSAIGNKGASIVNYSVKIGDKIITSTESGDIEFGTISLTGESVEMSVIVTDSRNYTTTCTKDLVVYEYKDPTMSVDLYRKNNYEEESHLIVNVKYSSINGCNSISILYQYGKTGEGFGNLEGIENGKDNILTCDKNYSYDFKVYIFDALGVSITKDFVLSKGKFPLFIDTRMNAVGINAFPLDDDEALRVADGKGIFEDGIVLKSSTEGSTKMFLLTVDDSGAMRITEYIKEN